MKSDEELDQVAIKADDMVDRSMALVEQSQQQQQKHLDLIERQTVVLETIAEMLGTLVSGISNGAVFNVRIISS